MTMAHPPRLIPQQLADADTDTFRAPIGMVDYKAHNPDFQPRLRPKARSAP